jgi:hypothetical protein
MTLPDSNPYFEFMTITGSVLQSNNWSETHVSGGGGGGMTYAGHGSSHVNAISSQVVSQGEIWVRDETGKEHHLRFSGIEVPTRNGHILSAIYGRAKRDKDGMYFSVLFYNHTSGEFYRVNKAIEDIAYKSLPVMRHGGFWLGSMWLILLVSAFFTRHPARALESLMVIGLGAWFLSWMITAPQVSSRKKKLLKILNQYSQDAPRINPADYQTTGVADAA